MPQAKAALVKLDVFLPELNRRYFGIDISDGRRSRTRQIISSELTCPTLAFGET